MWYRLDPIGLEDLVGNEAANSVPSDLSKKACEESTERLCIALHNTFHGV